MNLNLTEKIRHYETIIADMQKKDIVPPQNFGDRDSLFCVRRYVSEVEKNCEIFKECLKNIQAYDYKSANIGSYLYLDIGCSTTGLRIKLLPNGNTPNVENEEIILDEICDLVGTYLTFLSCDLVFKVGPSDLLSPFQRTVHRLLNLSSADTKAIDKLVEAVYARHGVDL